MDDRVSDFLQQHFSLTRRAFIQAGLASTALASGTTLAAQADDSAVLQAAIADVAEGPRPQTAPQAAPQIGAPEIQLWKTVPGVMTADPRVVRQARKVAVLQFDEMLEMAGAGSKVLALRSVEFARNHDVPIHVRSSFTWEEGTWVVGRHHERMKNMEEPVISGVVQDASESKITILGVPDRPGVSADIFEALAKANVNVDMIVQNTSTAGTTDISFTVPKADVATAEPVMSRVAKQLNAGAVTHDDGIAKVSLVGAGMKTSPGVAAKMFRVLADNGVNIEMISTSTIRVSVVVRAAMMQTAVQALHTAFGLDSGDDYAAPLPERK